MNMTMGVGVGFDAKKRKIIVRDDFNRVDDTLSLGNAITGQAWTALTGTWSILSNRARVAVSSTSRDFAVVEGGSANRSVQVVISVVVNNIRIVGRCVDATNLIFATVDTTAGDIKIYKLVANVATLIGTSPLITVNSGDTLKLLFSGSTIKLFVNGVDRLTVTETAHQTATKYGIGGNASTAIRFEDFIIESI